MLLMLLYQRAAINARSAALRIESFHQAPIDLRIDWSEDVVGALRALVDEFMAENFQAFWRQLPLR